MAEGDEAENEAEARAGNGAAAIQALETYLARAPASEDRWLIESDLEILRARPS